MKAFDGLDYTREALAEELTLIERHARDGSAVDAGCACIEEKHLLTVSGLASEGVTLAKEKGEKEFYLQLADLARKLRKKIVYADFNMHAVMREVMGDYNPSPKIFGECEKKLERCIIKVKKESPDVNPYAVCNAKIKC